MQKSGVGFLLVCLLVGFLIGCSSSPEPLTKPGLRGVYVQAGSITSPESANETLSRIEAGHFDTIFVNVFAYGHAYYDSALLEKHPDVAEGFDPLDHIIERAHRQGVNVHAWLVAGPVGHDGPGPILSEHPEWAMMGPDGLETNWLNYTRPDVRNYITELVAELVQGYAIDGVHFDYTRYPGAQWGFDSYSTALFSDEYGVDPDLFRYEQLPAYATFSGNPLIWPNSAEVLAEFDNGQPAVTINEYGMGQSILLNWDASERETVAGSQILDRSVDYLLDPDGELYILYSETNAARYGSAVFGRGFVWLEDLGRQPTRILESDIDNLDSTSVLVLPQVYLLEGQVASDLADFVHRGGGAIFIDGPTPSMWNPHVRAVTGMLMRGRHFGRSRLLLPTREHVIVPSSSRTLPLEAYEELDADWKAFRAQAISKLLAEVHERTKRQAPELLLSVSVSSDQELLAHQHLLDWRTWLATGTVDMILPRAYVAADESLARAIGDWRSTMAETGHIALALSTYTIDNEDAGPKAPERILSEISVALEEGSVGIVLFDLEHTSDAVLEALATGPFSASDEADPKRGE